MTEKVQIAIGLDTTPNVPYFPEAISRQIVEKALSYSSFEVREDALAVYAHYSNGRPESRVVIDTHLDHPGFVLDRSGKNVISVGSIALPEMVDGINQSDVPVLLFTKRGDKIGEARLVEFHIDEHRARAALTESYPARLRLRANTQVIPDLQPYADETRVFMRSADNLSVTAVALELMSWVEQERPVADLTFIFTKLEEVRQISATGIARRNGTPFGQFDSHTCIVVLEAASIGQTEQSRRICQRELNYSGGVVVRISDNELVYKNGSRANLAEALALYAAEDRKITVQHGPLINNSDATPFTLFTSHPHIVGLTVPCLYKHNFTDEGRLTHEIVSRRDLDDLSGLLRGIVLRSEERLQTHPDLMIQSSVRYDVDWNGKRHDWKAAYYWAKPRLRRRKIFADSLVDEAHFLAGSLRSHFL